MMTTEQILGQLNSYDGDNIWQDIIWGADWFDASATEGLAEDKPLFDGDVVTTDGVVLTWREQDRTWGEYGTLAKAKSVD